jgi:hypothetical protein
MVGFSGGGQFAHRFLYLYPERWAAVSVGAPGRVTMLNFSQKWPVGVADTETLFDRSVSLNRIQQVAIQLVVGSGDNRTHGGKHFWTWLQLYRNKAENQQGLKPSIFFMRVGTLITPAVQIKMLNLPRLFSRNSSAHERTLARDVRSRMEELGVARQEDIRQGHLAFFRSRAVRKSFAPVEARAWAVSTPMPPEQPIMRIV